LLLGRKHVSFFIRSGRIFFFKKTEGILMISTEAKNGNPFKLAEAAARAVTSAFVANGEVTVPKHR